MMSTNIRVFDRDELSLMEMTRILWHGKWVIFFVTLIVGGTIASVGWLIPKQYSATVLVSPVTSSTSASQLGGFGALGSQLGGLASLAGVSLGGDPKKNESLAVLQSDEITRNYIISQNLLPVLFSKNWDAEKGQWKTSNPKKVPTAWKANQYFKKGIRTVTTDPKTGLSTMTIKWKDPVVAAKWANDLVKMTNDYMRADAIRESERNITYLNEQALKTDILGARQAIYTLLQTEINKQMLARGSDAFALKIIDPAEPPEEQSSPKKLNWLLAGFFSGLFLSIAMLFLRVKWQAVKTI